jgi:hypothetical protein
VEHRHLLPDEIDLLLDDEAGFGVAPLRAHVRRCLDCRIELEEARAVLSALDQLPHLVPSPLFADRVMQQVAVFEPWHVAALDTLRPLVPRSRPARALALTGALSAAALVSIAAIWMVARLDTFVFIFGVALERARASLLANLNDAIGSVLGDSSAALAGSGGGLLAVLVVSAFLVAVVVAAAGLRAMAGASRRRRE